MSKLWGRFMVWLILKTGFNKIGYAPCPKCGHQMRTYAWGLWGFCTHCYKHDYSRGATDETR